MNDNSEYNNQSAAQVIDFFHIFEKNSDISRDNSYREHNDED